MCPRAGKNLVGKWESGVVQRVAADLFISVKVNQLARDGHPRRSVLFACFHAARQGGVFHDKAVKGDIVHMNHEKENSV